MMEERYSHNERLKRFALIICGLTVFSIILGLLTYWLYVQWNKVEPKKGKFASYYSQTLKIICKVRNFVINCVSDCTTKDLNKCSALFGAVSIGTEFNNCSWFENTETVWCKTVYSDNNRLMNYGYCQANCSFKGNESIFIFT